MVFIGKNKAKLSRYFFLPFFSVLRVFAPHAPQTRRMCERYIATTSPAPPRVASQTLRGAYASLKIWYAKILRPKLAKASPESKPRIRPTCHNFGPPALRSKRCVAPMLRQIFRSQNFRGATVEEEGSKGKPWKKKVPTTSREWDQLTTIFGHPRREWNAAWRPCFAKISGTQNFRGPSWQKRVPNANRESDQLATILGSRVAIETLRSANASPNFSSQNFRDATLEEEGSEGKPYKEIGSNDKPRTKPTAPLSRAWSLRKQSCHQRSHMSLDASSTSIKVDRWRT